MSMVINLDSDSAFEAFINDSKQRDKVICVDFWAPWCGPCINFSPVFEKTAEEMTDVAFVKINIDQNPQTAAKNEVKSIPTILLIKNGECIRKHIGSMNQYELADFISE